MRTPSWAALRDPLLQFALIGGVLFAIDAWLRPAGVQPIRIPAGLTAEQQTQRIDAEILVREARARGLDRGDSLIERQLQQKMRALVESSAPIDDPADATLRAWLLQHPERYAEPERLDVDIVFFPRSRYAAAGPEPMLEILKRLRAGEAVQEPPIERWQGVSGADLRRRYGRELAAAAAAAGPEWSGPVSTGLGWQLLRLNQRHAPQPPDFGALRERLLVDWREAQREEALAAALARWRERYPIVIDTP